MLKKINQNYLLLFFLILFQSFFLNSMEKEPDVKAAIVKANHALEKARETIKGIPDLLANNERKLKAREDQKVASLISQCKDQNTVLSKWGDVFAFYKGDVIKGTCFLADLLGEFLIYKKIVNFKVDHVLEMIKQDGKNLEELLQNAEIAQKNYEERNRVVRFVLNRFRTLPEISEIRKYVNKNHNSVNYNPFRENLIPYLFLALVKTKILHFIEDRFLVQVDMKYLFNEKVYEASQLAYEKDYNGNLRRLDITPLSILSILIFFINPRYMIERINFSTIDLLKIGNQFLGLGIPQILLGRIVKVIALIASVGLAVKFVDSVLNRFWADYLLKNRADFLRLLTNYNSIPKSEQTNLKIHEKKLRDFIAKGHYQSILSTEWLKQRVSSKQYVNLLILSPLIGAIAWKFFSIMKAN